MTIVKTDVPMTAALCEETVLELVRRYPFLRSQVLAGPIWDGISAP